MAGTPRAWTAEQDAALITGYLADDTLGQLAREAGCDIFHVWNRVAALRREGHDLPARRPPWTPQRKALLASRYREGASLRQLEFEFERTRGTITKQLARLKDDGHDLTRTASDGSVHRYGDR